VEVDVVSLASEFPNDNPALHGGVSWVCLDVTGRPAPQRAPAIDVGASVEALEAEVLEAEVPEAEVLEAEVLEAEVPVARSSGIVPRGDTARDEESEHDLAALSAAVARLDAGAEEDDDTLILVEELPPLGDNASLEGVAPAAVATTLPPAPDDAFTLLVCTLADIALGAGSPYVASILPGLLHDGAVQHPLADDAAGALAEARIVVASEVTPAFRAQSLAWRAILLGTSDDFGACGGAMLDEWAADLLARLLGAPARATALRRDLRSRGVAAFGLVEAA
jgi:hypothetical protein